MLYSSIGLFSSAKENREYQNELFTLEQKRQREAVGRIEKIEVRYLGLPEDATLVMNKNISTPFNCAQRKTISISKFDWIPIC